ncbi:MAG: hypothetical protein DSY84_07220, partial [Candidatus Neomarinimicrobiota bacterium]
MKLSMTQMRNRVGPETRRWSRRAWLRLAGLGSLTGGVALAHEEMQSVEKGMGFAGALSLTLVIGLLAIGLGSLPLVAATFITLIMGLIWTATFAILALGSLNLISVAFAVLFIGLSVDFGIHYGLRYKEGIDRGDAHA